MTTATELSINWVERGYVPDIVIRKSIQRLCRARLQEIEANDSESAAARLQSFIAEMNRSPIALLPDKANEQHYEVPAALYQKVLGNNLKYSCCYWDTSTQSLDQAEARALALTAEHAGLDDGQKILELGCGWGSLTLWMARQYPEASITAVSNSNSQREFILNKAQIEGIKNIKIITADMNEFDIEETFDRIVSVEMFEHMRNYRELFGRVAGWLNDDGRFFMHVFCHRLVPYAFIERDASDWMSRYFFSGGMMPSDDLPLYFQNDLVIAEQWRWPGTHYEKTANAWLKNMDASKELWDTFESIYGKEDAMKWWMRWRIFFMACAELFGYHHGQEWWVSHYLFQKRKA